MHHHVWLCDELAHSNALGWQDIQQGVPVAEDTIFRLASMTKPIVSVALMQCYEAGLVQLNDPVHEFIPAFEGLQVQVGREGYGAPITEPAARAMTVHDLMTHQSGLPGSMTVDFPTVADRVASAANEPLMFQPGTRFNYGFSTDVVGHLVELISGQTLDAYLEEHVFGPLGMHETGFGVPASRHARVAVPYMATSGGLEAAGGAFGAAPQEHPTYLSGAGGLAGTTTDYDRFARMLCNQGSLDGQRIISRKTLELMTSNHLTGGLTLPEVTDDTLFTPYHGIGFGLGFGITVDPARAQLSGTAGEYFWTGAFGSLVFVDPREELAVVFMTQALPVATMTSRIRNPYGWRELRALVYSLLI